MNAANAYKYFMGEDIEILDLLDIDKDATKELIEKHYQSLKEVQTFLSVPSKYKWWIHIGSGVSGLLTEKFTSSKKDFSFIRAVIYYMVTFSFTESLMVYKAVSQISDAVENSLGTTRDKLIELTDKFG